jgi:uncharacterized protein (TIGR02145 family)
MKKLLYLLLAAVILFAGCKEDDNATSEFLVNLTAIQATAAADSYLITVTGNAAWTAAADAEWLSLSPASGNGNGTITVVVTENVTTDPRTATVTFTAGTLRSTVSVTQAGITLDVDPETIDLANTAGTYTIAVTSNAAWTATADAEWLSLSPASGNDNSTVTVTIAGNATQEARTATITFAAGTVSRTVSLSQAAAPAPPDNAASAQIWVIGTQTWSDHINVPDCNKTEFNGGTPETPLSDCRNNPGYYYMYSWQYIKRNAASICPPPWRVPGKDDFTDLDIALGGTGENRADVAESWITAKYITAWGGVYGGYASGSTLDAQDLGFYYWSSTEYPEGTTAGYTLNVYKTGRVNPKNFNYKDHGFHIRCVK